tara:strand:+ start:3144 stop:4049 length:906 start_codon:yes stop_codon:yes gene_type:complete
MKLSVTTCSLVLSGLLGFTGCKKETATPIAPTAPAAPSSEEGGHVHADGTVHAAHGGHAAGPHDGTVVDWGGGKYHVEFTVDHDKQEGTIYILGSDEKSPVPIDTESIDLSINDPVMQVSLKAAPQKSDPAGKASRFVGNHKSLGVVQEYAGTISGVIDGTPYSGDFTEEAHGAHGHSHGPDDSLVWEGETREHAGLQIQLGHHGKQLHAGEEVEPAVSIVRNGKPVDDAKVFNALVSADGQTVLAKEVATVYEPTTDDEPAHYAQGALAIPSDVSKVILRFRIVPAGADPVTFDVPVAVK